MADNLFYHYPQNSIAAFYALGTSPKIKSKNQGCVQSQNGVDLLEASIFFSKLERTAVKLFSR